MFLSDQVSLPTDILGMQVKTPAQLGRYVSRVMEALAIKQVYLKLQVFEYETHRIQTGLYLTVKNLNYYVQASDNPHKHILKDMNFYIKPGMMCLVLGSPGGGRSSLFKVDFLVGKCNCSKLLGVGQRYPEGCPSRRTSVI